MTDKLFYRYYDEKSDPFNVSSNNLKKYGSGIYFLDNDWFYKNDSDSSRLITVRLKLKNPLIFENHKNIIPNFEYSKMIIGKIKSKEIKNRNDFTEYLKSQGYDGMIIHEPRGVYVIIFENNPELYEVVSDVSVSSFSEK